MGQGLPEQHVLAGRAGAGVRLLHRGVAADLPSNPKTKQPEYTYFKAIQGNDSLYVLQKVFKYEPSRDEIVKWTLYLKNVSVCDSRIAERACPATKN